MDSGGVEQVAHENGKIEGDLDLTRMNPAAQLDVQDLMRIFHKSKRAVERAVSHRQLPTPFKLFGKRYWTAGAILEFFQSRQAEALKISARRDAKLKQAG